MDLGAYRQGADAFLEAIQREYYLHMSGQKDELEIEPLYERHADLFSREAVDSLRPAGNLKLLEFAVQGHIGQETKAEEAELARREAELEIEVDGERMPFRQAAVVQANEENPERRRAIDAARNEATETELNPLLLEMLERSHALAGELGFASYSAMCQELSETDFGTLAEQTAGFLDATEARYREVVEPEVERHLGIGFDELQRADLPAFFRAPRLDEHYPADDLLPTFDRVVDGLAARSGNVRLDVEPRPKKSPRAFCSPVLVPDEVYLVITRIGGREDYETLFHEAGHALHYAHVDRELPFEDRCLGDNSVTEGFAFLMQNAVGREEQRSFERAEKIVFLRRYAAKLAYELELHGGGSIDGLRDTYARSMSDAVKVDWPGVSWLSDVDPFFYVARYLRAWALETHLRRLLRERFGEGWHTRPEAGVFLKELWREGQRLNADQLLGELTGAHLDFAALLEEL